MTATSSQYPMLSASTGPHVLTRSPSGANQECWSPVDLSSDTDSRPSDTHQRDSSCATMRPRRNHAASAPPKSRWQPLHRSPAPAVPGKTAPGGADRKSTRLNSSHVKISYAVFCLKKKTQQPGL